MTTVAELNYQRKQAGLPLIRFNLRKLQPEDIQDLRDAYAAMYEISDTAIGDRRGYTALARGHGYDQDLCHNDNRIFLTWHRAYVYQFEKALNSALKWKRGVNNLELTLPYWDWTVYDPNTDAANGIPAVVDEPDYTDAGGNTVKNPLASAKSLYRTQSQGLSGNDAWTVRYPDNLRANIPGLADDVDRYMGNPDFMTFSNDFNFGAHGTVHVVVGGSNNQSPLPSGGGDMGSVVSAAFDPIFWLHHCMVDKVWYDWQNDYPHANIPQHVLDTIVYGNMPGSATIDAENSLQYIYSEASVQSAVASSGTAPTVSRSAPESNIEEQPALASSPETPTPSEVPVGTVYGPFKRAQLNFHQLRPPKENYEIRAFANNPEVSADTPLTDDSYLGRMVLFGHGVCHGARGHCNPLIESRDEYDLRPKHPLRYQSTRYSLDVTRGIRRLLGKQNTANDVLIYLVTLDGSGKQVATNSVKYSGVSYYAKS